MEKLKQMLPYLLIMIGIFYILPMLIIDTGSGMFILLVLVPLACLLTSLAYGFKNSFTLTFPILVMLIFIPSIFIFYNDSAIVYVFAYGAISLVGSFLGASLSGKI
ncbi:hypothetical protein [Anaerococcus lactolyticus]|uniref:Exosortase n=2 Tax=Anaerococcus lactolyticus TaxID=33032 RepID=C2BDV3_9FIRM|nr:hypothetical protein [Anaerococcus lactolyticus]EEI86968.1 hypothetical protein HMPREF0072_0523 [Anaerococcus lactolyticus ATCC 51172]KGF04070.1 exosortase [Anaerococcus lactolyticus S7-1-13]